MTQAILLATSLTISVFAAEAAKKNYDIPAANAVVTLKQFAAQSGEQLLYSAEQVEGVKTNAVSGKLTAREALDAMVASTTLAVTQDKGTGALAVTRASDPNVARVALPRSSDRPNQNKSEESQQGLESPVLALDAYQVTEAKPRAFSDRNADIPRTVNDVQPYVIFNAKVIEESGAINMEDFLRNNLTMVNQKSTNAANTTSYGASSNITMRGLAATQTLVLVDGRRLPNVFVAGSIYQADLNGIPMSAIDRIEVLPVSASAIYGGSAVAGVINVILKKNYTGGQVTLSYDTPLDTDAAIRTVNATYGLSFENGRSHLTISGQYSDAHALTAGDRRDVVVPRIQQILKNAPDFFFNTTTNPFLGNGVNIASNSTANLVLKAAYGGQTLPATYTNLPAGITGSTSAAAIGAGLFANAGTYNMNLANVNVNASNAGTNSIFGMTPVTKGFSASFNRQMLKNLEAFVQYDYNSNYAFENYNGTFTGSTTTIPAASPINPFTTAVVIKTPLVFENKRTGTSSTRTLVAGVTAKLPKDWIGQLDFTHSQNSSGTFLISVDSTALNAAVLSGAFNPFVDPLLDPPSFAKYGMRQNFDFKQAVNTLGLRASGPLPALPWGTPTLAIRAERRFEDQKDGTLDRDTPATPSAATTTTYLAFRRDIRSANAELLVPLVAQHRFPLLYSLQAQLAGSREEDVVDTGTPTKVVNKSTGVTTYGSPVLNGLPFRGKAVFTSSNPTVGVLYQPIKSIILRASTGTAFLPPTTSQLTPNPLPNPTTTNILDPKTNTTYAVQTLSGGNPGVQPQSSRTDTFGVIWQQRWGWQNLRLEADYSNIREVNAISTLGAQQILNLESAYPGRVTRDATGNVTLIDVSSLNLYKNNFESWDFLLDYRITTAKAGTFTFKARETLVLHSKYQFSLTSPMYDAVGYPTENGAMKNRLNLSLEWEHVHWHITWNARYFDSYFEYGAAGGQLSNLAGSPPGTGDYSNYIRALGSRTVASQFYHDVIFGYNFGSVASAGRASGSLLGSRVFDGLSVQLGIKNVFNLAPAFDTGPFAALGLMSSYGDNRMRDIFVSLKRTF